MFFYQLALLSNNLVLISYQLVLLRVMVILDRGRGAENIEEKIKTDGRKTLKNEDKENQRI